MGAGDDERNISMPEMGNDERAAEDEEALVGGAHQTGTFALSA